MKKTVKICAPAKINLYLDIKSRRSDGYHNIESVMQSIDLCDIVTVSADTSDKTGKVTVSCDVVGIPSGEDNICFSAVREFNSYCGSDFTADIHIEKHIPAGAGMGGGSTDAAAVIAALNNIYGTGMDTEELCNIAARVGADVPFCLAGGTRYCTGKGDILRRLKNLPECIFVIGKGERSVSTAEAYRDIDSAEPIALNNAAALFCSEKIEDMAPLCGNIFEKTVDLPEVSEIKKIMLGSGALCSVMTGSGSAVFGIFTNKDAADCCAGVLKGKGYFSAAAIPVTYGSKLYI